jgi:hypothetical protein
LINPALDRIGDLMSGTASDLETGEDLALEARIEAICARGCQRVRADIRTLEQGGELPETRGLAPGQRDAILNELNQIMAVYGARCRIDGALDR